MAQSVSILAFAGSLRQDSYNKKLVKVAAEGARGAGAQVTYLDLRNLPLPIYDGDLEARDGLPENARELKRMLSSHQGWLISAPEYNSSISGALKNAIDWASRQEKGEAPLACFKGKVVGLLSASPGSLGGLRGLVTVRSILGNIGVFVLPDQVSVPKANENLANEGAVADPKLDAAARKLGETLVQITAKLHSTAASS